MPRLITVDTSDLKKCAKCGKEEPPFNRHHKGFDSFVGLYNRGIGRNYSRFKDCVVLCVDCHAIIHFIYQPYCDKWINKTPRGAAHFRKVLIAVCDKWLAGKIQTPKVPARYLREFRERYQEWLRNQEQLGTGSAAT